MLGYELIHGHMLLRVTTTASFSRAAWSELNGNARVCVCELVGTRLRLFFWVFKLLLTHMLSLVSPS